MAPSSSWSRRSRDARPAASWRDVAAAAAASRSSSSEPAPPVGSGGTAARGTAASGLETLLADVAAAPPTADRSSGGTAVPSKSETTQGKIGYCERSSHDRPAMEFNAMT